MNAQWQPIETAPRDKTRIALLRVDGNSRRYGTGWYMPLTGWQGWYSDNYHEPPTHWFPLPEPPK